MKYTITTLSGDRIPPDRPRIARLSRPPWAAKFRFFTHEAVGTDPLLPPLYSVSELKTGRRIGLPAATRAGAVENAQARLKQKGYRAFCGAIKKQQP